MSKDESDASQSATQDDDEPDEWDKRIFSTGCADENAKLTDCYFDKKDWRQCTQEASLSTIGAAAWIRADGRPLAPVTECRWPRSRSAGRGTTMTRGLRQKTHEHSPQHHCCRIGSTCRLCCTSLHFDPQMPLASFPFNNRGGIAPAPQASRI
ncbi:uncharacterized protein B0I36DRAFT_16728 [Microdochium trichocladiopsis]|uniref:Uncharacterized protein n=1 Tax=Microdochium trichocladiopsis TaxID=1682393 RepID=A0A9P8YIB0_9PEZI|nr:uncharacterized protein B0I36DRAFT_16728 [Microdochium trichocladiopsis]KAH7040909.1 hypothetical protein B0I36DRAFT_16728 [Microdochium trichocladiopsis]